MRIQRSGICIASALRNRKANDVNFCMKLKIFKPDEKEILDYINFFHLERMRFCEETNTAYWKKRCTKLAGFKKIKSKNFLSEDSWRNLYIKLLAKKELNEILNNIKEWNNPENMLNRFKRIFQKVASDSGLKNENFNTRQLKRYGRSEIKPFSGIYISRSGRREAGIILENKIDDISYIGQKKEAFKKKTLVEALISVIDAALDDFAENKIRKDLNLKIIDDIPDNIAA